MSRPFMPFYSGDWMRDTAHLSDTQERAYFRLMMFYWDRGGLPSDEKQLARITHLTAAKWQKNREILASFFDENWKHKRIEKEIEKSEKFLSKQRANGAKPKAKHKPAANQNETRAPVPQPQPQESSSFHSEDSNLASLDSAPEGAPPPKAKKSKKPKPRTQILPDAQPTDADKAKAAECGMANPTFRHEWAKFRDHHVTRGSTMVDWQAAWRTWCAGWTERGKKQIGALVEIAPEPINMHWFYAAAASPQFEAWAAFYQTTRKQSPPRDARGGWRFPTEWPPGYGDDTPCAGGKTA